MSQTALDLALDVQGQPVEVDAEDRARLAAAEAAVLRAQIVALSGCCLRLGSDKRFVRDVARADPARISPRQRAHVVRLCWRYRRQMPKHLVPAINPDDPLYPDWVAGKFRG